MSAAVRLGLGRPDRQQAEALSRRIVEEALGQFRLKGFAATTIEEVAAACGTAKQSVYRRFPSKEALFTAAVGLEEERMLGQVRAIEPGSSDPLVRLKALCRSLLDVILQPGAIDLFRMTVAETPRFPAIADRFAECCERVKDVLEPAVSAAQAAGQIRPGDPRALAWQMHNFIIGEALTTLLLGRAFLDDPEERGAYFEANWNLMLSGVAALRA